MKIRPAALWVLPEPPIFIQASDRPRIGITIVEVADLFGDTPQCRIVFHLRNYLTISRKFQTPDVQSIASVVEAHAKSDVIEFFSNQPLRLPHYSCAAALFARAAGIPGRQNCPPGISVQVRAPPLKSLYVLAAAATSALTAASFSFSALIAGANCAITASRLNESAFWSGGYLTKFSIWAATR